MNKSELIYCDLNKLLEEWRKEKKLMNSPHRLVFKKGRKITGKSKLINTTYFRRLIVKYHKENNTILVNQAYKRYLEMGGKLSLSQIISKG